MIISKHPVAKWVHHTNIYEVNLRQYTQEGTFSAFAKEMPRLKDMGVEVLWFMPIHPIGKLDRKGVLGSYYSIENYLDTNPEFGSIADFKELVQQAHTLELKVIIDWVANHSSNDNVWIGEHRDYFVQDDKGNIMHPYDWDDVSKLNYDNPDLRKAMIDAMKFWLTECNIDGYRCDMAHLVPLDFWEAARTEIDTIKPGLFWLAETEDISYHEVFDASYTWEWMHKTEDYCKGYTDMNGLYSVLDKYKKDFPATAFRLYYTSNHDENSHTGTEYDKFGDAAKALAVFSCTYNGIPLIYSGQEAPNRKKLAFFEKDIIEWTDKMKLHVFYKTLLNLHSNNAAMSAADIDAAIEILSNDKPMQVISYIRKKENDAVLVLLNLSNEYIWPRIYNDTIVGNFKNIFTSEEYSFEKERYFEMPPWSYLVYEKQLKRV
ncbi:alpha-amylase family glycosyl hydrolase [Ferruginibacter albus]|uniref:alpha-amylase family glycosyl hydrolase n=1 Tax=Ferruginibacter albus TaxID=2875540 RepID=UPI001CC3491E|nr:alpha-amylase family glycosyl hydrolase [Ferruginibacter albus]UAY51103.1 1,4-alpha-glucan branching protein [Ferruginibacter albus]